ncbi:hypothetical protein CO660_26710 [Rhizobium sp. L9]|uniref:hypothetical protein n=1 Tax=Rhizobium sp. L9 TaxID=1340738 RepID=UPI000BEACACA|nr:hypothetical protein [Rhizobium sp. L9]PDT26721.1 hypothetical protein CO660_26710 [Rhizobium sp. L9]
MTTVQNLTLYTRLAGFRLVVLANRLGCDSDFSRALHDRLVDGLDAAIARIQAIAALERMLLAGDDELTAYRLEGEIAIFARFAIDLVDDLEIDRDTQEFRVNGGDWTNALAADVGGVEVNYPELVALTPDELGSLAPIIEDIMRETGIRINAVRATR